jgi:2-polyprenyl-6-methoxyphenol hydroxylase-like FAD-dependent oxidoreductase
MVLQVLYDNIKDKSKVLTGKRVATVQLKDGGVAAVTTDNSVYEGDIVIGADGIHSTVRSEMWRLGHQLQPGWFDRSEEQGKY